MAGDYWSLDFEEVSGFKNRMRECFMTKSVARRVEGVPISLCVELTLLLLIPFPAIQDWVELRC